MNSQTYFQERTVTPFRPYSMSYAGHQFGWAGQLGDGRAIILAEIENKNKFIRCS
jgi:uncharacterized protein YdiU (UPF0061 family)